MLLLNYLGRKRTESGMVAGFTISVPWDAQKSSDSMEEPLNWLLFNKYLTSGLCRAVTRSGRISGVHTFMNLKFNKLQSLTPSFCDLFAIGTGKFWRKWWMSTMSWRYAPPTPCSSHSPLFPVCVWFHFFSALSLSASRGQSVSLTSASPLCSLVTILVLSTTAMPAQTKSSPTRQCPSCVSTLLTTPSLPNTVRRHQEEMKDCCNVFVPNFAILIFGNPLDRLYY